MIMISSIVAFFFFINTITVVTIITKDSQAYSQKGSKENTNMQSLASDLDKIIIIYISVFA